MESLLDRLAGSERLETWRPDELEVALAEVAHLDAARRGPDGRPRALDIRLAIYHRRLRSELDRRAADTG